MRIRTPADLGALIRSERASSVLSEQYARQTGANREAFRDRHRDQDVKRLRSFPLAGVGKRDSAAQPESRPAQ